MKTKHLLKCCLFVIAAIFVNQSFLLAQAGVPDSSFGIKGKVLTSIPGKTSEYGQSVAVSADGKIIVAGTSDDSLNNLNVIRYLTDGRLDKSFNGTGYINIHNALGGPVALQQDNKIVVAGYTVQSNKDVILVYRFNNNGTRDSSFGNNGVAQISFAFGAAPTDLKIQPDGKMVISASAQYLVVIRLNKDGSLDNSFAAGGKYVNRQNFGQYVNVSSVSVILQPDGKIIVPGQFNQETAAFGNLYSMLAMRLQPNGVLDSSFGANGISIYRRNYHSRDPGDHCFNGVLLPNSKILLCGESELSGYNSPASMLRLNNDGSIDSSFGNAGWQHVGFGNAAAYAATLLLQNNKIILAGGVTFSNTGSESVFLARCYMNGTLDPTFAKNGKDTFFTSYNESCSDAVLQADGKIVITGSDGSGGQSKPNKYITARFLNSASGLANTNYIISKTSLQAGTMSAVIFPNPVINNQLNINLNIAKAGKINISVYDANGKRITATYSKAVVAGLCTETIQLPALLANGLYECVIDTDNTSTALKFLIEK